MRRFFLLFILFLLYFISNGQNRVVTLLDVAKYGTYLTVGDLIVDKPTNGVPFADGINQLRYTNFSKSFPTFREDGTIWIDGEKIGPLCEIRFLNGTESTPWHVTTVNIKPLPGTRINGIATQNSYGGFLWLVQGLKHLWIDGENAEYPGLSAFPSDRVFLKGTFGISATSTGIYGGRHMFSISVLDGGTFKLSGVEAEHGFSLVRFEGGSYNWTVHPEIYRCYLHDSGSEVFYIGATHALPYAYIKDLQLHDIIIARSGSEAIQLQHLVGNKGHVYNISIFSADVGYLKQFQPGQDTGMQLSADEGTTVIEKIVIDSWGSHGINLFGSPYESTTKNTIIKNIILNNGRGEAVYIHPSCKYGMNWALDSLYIRNLTGDYYINNKTAKPNWVISSVNGTDRFTIGTNFYKDLPDVAYVNSGFYEPANMVKVYSRYYAKYISGQDTLAVDYKAGEIVIDREDGKQPVFTKCLISNRATSLRPKNDTRNYMVLTWDEKGVRNDRIGWVPNDQKLYPPDDFRVKSDNYYGKKGIGFVEDKPTYESLLIRIAELEKIITDLNSTILSKDSLINDLSDQALIYKQELIYREGQKSKYKLLIEQALAEMKD